MKFIFKPFIALYALIFAGGTLRADDDGHKWFDTTDRLEVSGIHSSAAADFITVCIAGEENRLYMAYNFDIILPPGVSFPETGTIARVGEINPNHLIQAAVKDHGARAKVICFSLMNDDFAAPIGSIANLDLTVHPLAKVGENSVEFRDFVFNSNDPAGADPIQWAPGNTLQNSAAGSFSIPAERSVEVNIPADQRWQTLTLPFALSELPDGVFAYRAVSINDDYEVELEEVSALEPYKPYMIYAPQGWTETLSGIASEEHFPADAIASHGVLSANINRHEREDGYLFTPHPDEPKFDIVSSSTHLAPGHVFIPAIDKDFIAGPPESLPLKILASVNISDVSTDTSADAPIYNLLGERILAPRPGQICVSKGKIYRK